MSVFSYQVKDSRGKEVSLNDYQGKVLLIVNTASKCGFTPQYADLERLYESLHARGLEILAFPCNQFGQQEPGTNQEIQEFCRLNYGVNFPVLAKIDVNGEQTAPLFQYLKQEKPGPQGGDIQWNFTKFLVNQQGQVVERFEPNINPEAIAPAIEQLLK